MFEISIDRGRHLVVGAFRGPVSLDDLRAAMHQMVGHPDFERGMHGLWDFREASLTGLSSVEIHEFVQFSQESLPSRGSGYRIAMVVSRPVDFGISRVYEAFGKTLPRTLGIFVDLDAAREWVLSDAPPPCTEAILPERRERPT